MGLWYLRGLHCWLCVIDYFCERLTRGAMATAVVALSCFYVCVVCLCFLFVCLCFCIGWRCLLAHRLNTLAIDPPAGGGGRSSALIANFIYVLISFGWRWRGGGGYGEGGEGLHTATEPALCPAMCVLHTTSDLHTQTNTFNKLDKYISESKQIHLWNIICTAQCR